MHRGEEGTALVLMVAGQSVLALVTGPVALVPAFASFCTAGLVLAR